MNPPIMSGWDDHSQQWKQCLNDTTFYYQKMSSNKFHLLVQRLLWKRINTNSQNLLSNVYLSFPNLGY